MKIPHKQIDPAFRGCNPFMNKEKDRTDAHVSGVESPAAGRKSHPHAKVMAQYAEDATKTGTPWVLWEMSLKHTDEFCDLVKHPLWETNVIYRRKPKMIQVGVHSFPEPLRTKPLYSECYYVADLAFSSDSREITLQDWWSDTDIDNARLRAGMVHLTEHAARLHANALISLTFR